MGDHRRAQHVFKGVELGQKMVELKNEPERLVAQAIAVLGFQVVDAPALRKRRGRGRAARRFYWRA
jgi:hypothetical protein